MPRHRAPDYVATPDAVPDDDMTPPYREFDCPQCVPMVAYRKVRKLVSEVDVDTGRRLMEPVKRDLAAAFGRYLLHEGLIKFAVVELPDRLRVTAQMGCVLQAPENLFLEDTE